MTMLKALQCDHNSGYVIPDPAIKDNQIGDCSVQYSNSMPDDYNYI